MDARLRVARGRRCGAAGSAARHVRDGPRRDGPDAIPDVPRLEGAAAGVGRGTILAEARARRECALAYRATVDAVYAEAELDAGARGPATVKPRTTPQRSGRVSRRTAPGPLARGPAGAWRLGADDRPEPRLRKACGEPDRTHDPITGWKHRRSSNSGLTSGPARSATQGSACPGRCWRCPRTGRPRGTTMPSEPPRRRNGSGPRDRAAARPTVPRRRVHHDHPPLRRPPGLVGIPGASRRPGLSRCCGARCPGSPHRDDPPGTGSARAFLGSSLAWRSTRSQRSPAMHRHRNWRSQQAPAAGGSAAGSRARG